MNAEQKELLKKTLIAVSGLFILGFGVYLTIQAGIGTAPWEAFCLGMSKSFGMTYGTASIIVGFSVLIIDLLLKEKIGIGMVLNAIIVGKTVDLFNYFDVIPACSNTIIGILVLLSGLAVMGWAKYLYMFAGLGCGPRDALMVGLSKKMKKTPIGVVNTIIFAVVCLAGWLLGGAIGIGTIISTVLAGPIMQAEFSLMKFDAESIVHQSISDSIRLLNGK